MEQQNENELTARRVRSSISRNDGIPGGWGIQEPIKSSKHFQRPALQSSKSESVPDTTKQLESGTQSKNKTGMFSFMLEIWDLVVILTLSISLQMAYPQCSP